MKSRWKLFMNKFNSFKIFSILTNKWSHHPTFYNNITIKYRKIYDDSNGFVIKISLHFLPVIFKDFKTIYIQNTEKWRFSEVFLKTRNMAVTLQTGVWFIKGLSKKESVRNSSFGFNGGLLRSFNRGLLVFIRACFFKSSIAQMLMTYLAFEWRVETRHKPRK